MEWFNEIPYLRTGIVIFVLAVAAMVWRSIKSKGEEPKQGSNVYQFDQSKRNVAADKTPHVQPLGRTHEGYLTGGPGSKSKADGG